MRITYAENPFESVVELDDKDAKILRLCILNDELTDMIAGAKHHLHSERDSFDPKQALKELTAYPFMDGEETLTERVNKVYAIYVKELKSSHAGDCMCLCATCSKCTAEDWLCINTIKGLGKYGGSRLNGAFSIPQIKTCADAIIWLKDHPPASLQAGANEHQQTVHAQREKVLPWLLNYFNTKLGNTEIV